MIEAPKGRKHHPILIVLHGERSSPGRVGQMLLDKGYDLDIRRPVLGERLPTTMEGHCRRGDLRRTHERQ